MAENHPLSPSTTPDQNDFPWATREKNWQHPRASCPPMCHSYCSGGHVLPDIESPYYWVRHLVSTVVWLACLSGALFGILQIAQHIGRDVLPLDSHFSASVDAARAAAAVGEHRMAVEHFSRAITINNSKADLWLGRAMSRLQLKDAQGALDDAAGAIARGLPEDRVLMVRARAAELIGKADDAIAQLDRIIAADPGALEARKMRAGLLANGGSLDKALADIDALLAVDPNDIDAKSLRAEIYLRRADWPSAASAFTDSAKISKAQPKLWIGAGAALLGMGANGEAQAAFEHAQSIHQAGSHVRSAAILGQALALRALGRLDAALNAWNVYSAVSRPAVAPSLQSIQPDENFLKRIYFEIASRPEKDDGFVPDSEETPPGPQPKP